MADDLASAKQRLLGNADTPPFSFDSLPLNDLSPLWDRIEAKYNLSLAELSALKNARCQVETTRNVRAKVAPEGLQSQLMEIDDDAEVISLRDGVHFHYKERFSELIVRDCYKKLFDIILDSYGTAESQGTIVTGNPGIGKSYFLFYCLFRFIKLGKTVVFESSQQNSYWLYRPNEATLCLEGVSPEDVFLEQLRSRSTVFLFDPNKDSPTSVKAFTIIAASPQIENFKEFFKTEGVNKLFMPGWSRAEVEKMPSSLTSDQKSEMYQKYGGIPRYIKNDLKWGAILFGKVDACNPTDVIKSAGLLENYRESHMLLQYVVNDDYQVESVQFASNYIFELLIKKWETSNKEALNLFFHETKAIKGLGVARGKVFEVLAHRVLVKGGTYRTRKLGTTSGSSSSSAATIDTNDFEIGELKHNYFNNIVGVDFTKNDEYWQPTSGGLTAIDSLAIVNNDLLLFQITINEQHGIKHKGIEDVVDVSSPTTNNTLKVYFVVPDDQFASYPEQKIINKDGAVRRLKAKFVIEQHVLGVALTAQTNI
mmetsp:Transcript_1142/g.1461  ORF Transcript_1142/g.1461 Transcript_1142/m.1461 type:complete len:538 (+) Transcript_1142:34-1647(+)